MFNRILVPLDGSTLSERALPVATLLGQATGGRLSLVRATGENDSAGGARQQARAYLESVAHRLGTQASVDVATPDGPAARGILAEIDRQHADLVVMTTHGHTGLQRLVHGSVAEAVLADSPVPVLLVRMNVTPAAAAWRPARPCLLLPLDGSFFAEAALRPAAAMARALDWTLVLLRVVASPAALLVDPEVARPETTDRIIQDEEGEADRYLHSLANTLRAEGLRVETRIRVGQAAQAILDEGATAGASLVVMATHGRTGLERLMRGSVASEVLHRGSLPLLLIRPSGVGSRFSAATASAL